MRSLDRLVQSKTQIPVTKNNQIVYDEWRKECAEISRKYFNEIYRVVDVERGFFNLVWKGQILLANGIYAAA